MIAAGTFGLDAHGIAAQAAAFAAALLGGLLLSWTDKRFGKTQEAIIGVSFVLAATGGLLLLANNPHGGEELRDLLVGQILFADVHTLTPAAVLAAVVLASWRLVMRTFGRPGFYLLFAVSVTASVQLVGVYLVFSSLIVAANVPPIRKKTDTLMRYMIAIRLWSFVSSHDFSVVPFVR